MNIRPFAAIVSRYFVGVEREAVAPMRNGVERSHSVLEHVVRVRPREWLLVGLILALAIVFRFYHLDSTPPGLFLDEAVEGNQALELIASGRFQVFYSENYGREGLFVWLAAFPLKMFGNQV